MPSETDVIDQAFCPICHRNIEDRIPGMARNRPDREMLDCRERNSSYSFSYRQSKSYTPVRALQEAGYEPDEIQDLVKEQKEEALEQQEEDQGNGMPEPTLDFNPSNSLTRSQREESTSQSQISSNDVSVDWGDASFSFNDDDIDAGSIIEELEGNLSDGDNEDEGWDEDYSPEEMQESIESCSDDNCDVCDDFSETLREHGYDVPGEDSNEEFRGWSSREELQADIDECGIDSCSTCQGWMEESPWDFRNDEESDEDEEEWNHWLTPERMYRRVEDCVSDNCGTCAEYTEMLQQHGYDVPDEEEDEYGADPYWPGSPYDASTIDTTSGYGNWVDQSPPSWDVQGDSYFDPAYPREAASIVGVEEGIVSVEEENDDEDEEEETPSWWQPSRYLNDMF